MTPLNRPRDERGTSAVEFALVLVPLLLLLFGMIQLSIYFWSGQSAATAAREAARRSVVGDLTCAELATAATSQIRMSAGAVTVTRSYYASSHTSINAQTPAKSAAQVTVGDNVQVVVRFQVIDMKFPWIPLPSAEGVRGRLAETAVARVESVSSKTTPC